MLGTLVQIHGDVLQQTCQTPSTKVVTFESFGKGSRIWFEDHTENILMTPARLSHFTNRDRAGSRQRNLWQRSVPQTRTMESVMGERAG